MYIHIHLIDTTISHVIYEKYSRYKNVSKQHVYHFIYFVSLKASWNHQNIQGHTESKDIICLFKMSLWKNQEKAAVLQVTFPALTNKLLMEKVSPLQHITGPRSPGKP